MTLIDAFTRECWAVRAARRINSLGAVETPADVMLTKSIPELICLDNDAEMTSSSATISICSVQNIRQVRST